MSRARARLEKLERWAPPNDDNRITVFRHAGGAFAGAVILTDDGCRELIEEEATAYLAAHPQPRRVICMTWGDAET